MDRIDWEFEKGTVLGKLALYAAFYAVVTITAGYFFHIGWAMCDPSM